MHDVFDEKMGNFTLLVEGSDNTLTDEIRTQFGGEDVSESSNFIGGVSIAVFLAASARSLQPTIKTILTFLAKRGGRYDNARIVFDGKKIELKGYRADDVEKILNNSAFDKLRQ